METLEKLRTYVTSSWAIWNKNGPDTLDFFRQHLSLLNPRVVFLGLNPSGNFRAGFGDFRNFHSPGHRGDNHLKNLIQGQKLRNLTGGFMTDLVVRFESNSRKVIVSPRETLAHLEGQLRILNEPRFTVICFGDKVFRSLRRLYGAQHETIRGLDASIINTERFRLDLFKVFHYSMNGFNNKNSIEKLPGQLRTVNLLAT